MSTLGIPTTIPISGVTVSASSETFRVGDEEHHMALTDLFKVLPIPGLIQGPVRFDPRAYDPFFWGWGI